MKPTRSVLLMLVALGACAPGAVVSNPSAEPTPVASTPVSSPDVATAAQVPAVDPIDAVGVAPDDWWLLDLSEDGMFGTSAERAYAELLRGREPAQSVVVAILDSGVDIEHPDLDDNLWVNEDEVANNGVDDDGNGYVDDVHGWSFLGGPGGDVEQDTYEVTRLYVQCQDRGEMNTPRCGEIANDFESERAEAEQLVGQYRSMTAALNRFSDILELELGTDSLTRENVAALQTTRPEVLQAKQVYLQLIDAGATPQVLAEGMKSLEDRLAYGLNPDFDPRPMVGDDFDDKTERIYGNDHIEGPAAEHGTHVAGIIAAERDNGVGMNGIGNGIKLMIVRTVPMGDERDKDVANAIRYAVDNGADIINMSFGKGYSPGKQLVDDAVKYAQEAGVLLVHAAGNAGMYTDTIDNFPNRYYQDGGQADLWIEVGASDWRAADRLAAPFSNYSADRVDVFAPGVAIYSTVPNDGYESLQGTSMASPVVAGLAGLIMAYYPELSAAQVKDVIMETATRFPDQSVVVPGPGGELRPFSELSISGGIVNAYAALKRAAELTGR